MSWKCINCNAVNSDDIIQCACGHVINIETNINKHSSASGIKIFIRLLSWPFLFMGGIGLGRYLVPMLLTSDYDETLKGMGGDSYGHWLLMIVIAGTVFAIGLILRWLTRAR